MYGVMIMYHIYMRFWYSPAQEEAGRGGARRPPRRDCGDDGRRLSPAQHGEHVCRGYIVTALPVNPPCHRRTLQQLSCVPNLSA